MNVNDWRNKLSDERPMTLEESARLDAALQATEDPNVLNAIKAMGDAEPSLAWRSSLNARLMATANKKRKQAVLYRASWAFACGCALWVGLLLVQPRQAQTEPSQDPKVAQASIEELILDDHFDAMSQASLGIYIGYGETEATKTTDDELRL